MTKSGQDGTLENTGKATKVKGTSLRDIYNSIFLFVSLLFPIHLITFAEGSDVWGVEFGA